MLAVLLALGTQNPPMEPGPNPIQQALIQRGYGMFIHFGINTFNETEWSDGTLPASSYHPTNLDVDSWIKTAKEAGFRHVVLTTKHHDGFCLWPSQATKYSVASSPVPTDIVSEVARACERHGVKLGLYYSLWDRHEPTHNDKENPQKYVDFMKVQLTELLTKYGPVCEIWFDGAWAKEAKDWDLPALYDLIHKLQPDCAVTVNHTFGNGQDPKPIGQPDAFQKGDIIRFWPVDFRTKDPNIVRADDPKHYTWQGQLKYLPFEHTICLSSRANWFQKRGDIPPRPIDELEELFYWCTANDNALLLNLPPDETGRLRAGDVAAALALADRLGIRGGNAPLPRRGPNLLAGASVEPTEAGRMVDTSWSSGWSTALPATLTLTWPRPTTFDRITLTEEGRSTDLGDGFSQLREFSVTSLKVEAEVDGVWKTVWSGDATGPTTTLRVPRQIATRLQVTAMGGESAKLKNLAAYDSALDSKR